MVSEIPLPLRVDIGRHDARVDEIELRHERLQGLAERALEGEELSLVVRIAPELMGWLRVEHAVHASR
jgi:hypothetical protein